MTISLTTALVFKGQLQRIPEQNVGLTGNPRHLPSVFLGRFNGNTDININFNTNLTLTLSLEIMFAGVQNRSKTQLH